MQGGVGHPRRLETRSREVGRHRVALEPPPDGRGGKVGPRVSQDSAVEIECGQVLHSPQQAGGEEPSPNATSSTRRAVR